MHPLIVISFGAVLLLSGCDKASKKNQSSTPTSPPPPLPIVAITEVPAPPASTVELKPGSNLGVVAQETYGHERFSGFISVINGIEDPTKIRDGTQLKTPSLAIAFQDLNMDPIYQPAINALAKATTDYFIMKPAFTSALTASTENGKPDISGNITTSFNRSADTIEAAILVLEGAKSPHSVPKKSIEQFRQASVHLKQLAKGTITTEDYNQDIVGQRLGLGFTNAILWTKASYQ